MTHPTQSALRKTQWAVTAILLLALLSVAWIFGHAWPAFRTTTESSLSNLAHADQQLHLLRQVRKSLGYGGFIHHYQNALLRGEEALLTRLRADHDSLLTTLDALRGHIDEPRSLADLALLEAVLKTYRQNIDGITQGWQQGEEARALDRRLRVDDAPALAALDRLEQAARDRLLQNRQALAQIDSEGSLFVIEIALFMLALLSLAAITLSLTRRVHHTLNDLQQTHEQLSEQSAAIQSILEISIDAIILIDEQGLMREVNPAAESLFGYARDELIGQNVSKLMPPHWSAQHDGYIKRYLDTGKAQIIGTVREVTCQTRDGRQFPADLSISEAVITGKRWFTGSLRDISARRATEDALTGQKKLFEGLFRSIPQALVVADPQRRIRLVNPAFCQLFGYSEDEVLGKSAQLLYRHEADFLQQGERRADADSRDGPDGHIVDYRTRDGRFFPGETIITRIDDSQGEQGFIGVIRDVSKRLQEQQRLLESENRLARSQKFAQSGTWDWHIESGDLYWSESIPSLFGYAPGALETSYDNFINAVHPDDRQAVNDAVQKSLNEGDAYDIEHRVVWPDGQTRWVLERGDALRNEDGSPLRMLGVVMDIDKRKRAEQELQQTNQDLAIISQTNAAIAQIQDEQTLLETVCRILVEVNDLTMAWVAQPKTQPEEPVTCLAHAGDHQAYLDSLHITWDDSDSSRGPVGQALKTGAIQSFADVSTDIDFTPWRETALEQGFHSVAALPLQVHQQVWGCLTLYSGRGDYFSDKRLHFLQQLAHNLSQGLEQRVAQRARNAAEQALIIYKYLFDRTAQGIGLTDAEGRFIYINAAHEQMNGFALAEVQGKHFSMMLPQEQAATLGQEIMATLTRGETWRGLLPQVRKDGSQFISLSNIGFVNDEEGNPTHLFNLFSDHTEEMLRQQVLQSAKEEAERANQAKSDFLSSMSHELRTPMNSIIGFSQLLEYDDDLNKEQRDNLHEISKAGAHLLKLINEVLDLAKIESGRIQLSLEPVGLGELVGDCLSLVEPLASKQAIRIDTSALDSNPHVRADRTRLKQVILNLLSNAIKYNRPSGRVTIWVAPAPAGALDLKVEDSGYGVATHRLKELFEPFNRLEQTEERSEGTGIGLTITKRLVEMMGGQVTVESSLGIGTTFSIRLPTIETGVETIEDEDSLVTSAPQQSPSVEQDSVKRVLYIEDNPANLKLVAQLFSKRPQYRLMTAHEGSLGVKLAQADPPDLVLLDINMPGMDGYAILQIFKADPRLSDIPVIAVTANAMPRDIERGLQAGFCQYVTKPIELKSFFDTINACLPPS